jgi:hypothetical protein
MQEEKKTKQKKETKPYRKLITYHTIIYYIRKTKRKLISFGVPKTKPKQSRQLPKTPNQNKHREKTKIIT